MRTYFKPLRRKLGIVMLVMACVCMAAWVRSLFIADVIEHATGRYSQDEFQSVDGVLAWWSDEMFDKSAIPFEPVSFRWNGGTTNAQFYRNHYHLDEVTMDWKLRWPWIGVGMAPRAVVGNDSRILRFVSYSLIVAPLTLLSVWLLLSKPRTPKPKPTLN